MYTNYKTKLNTNTSKETIKIWAKTPTNIKTL